MLLVPKRCIFHMQMRQFITFHMRNRNQMIQKTTYCGSGWKYVNKLTNSTNSNLTLYRFMSEYDSEKKKNLLPPLMEEQAVNSKEVRITSLLFTAILIRLTIDSEFRLLQFGQAAKGAMVLISEALSSQNYDELEGRVNEEAIKVLKDKVESLSSYQRKLIALDADKTICFPGDIVVKEEDNKKIIEITVQSFSVDETSKDMFTNFHAAITATYVFQRIYTYNGSWTGGYWTVKLVNHFA